MLTKDKQKNRGITRAEMIETIKKLAKRLGRVPTEVQVQTLTRLKRKDLRKHFTNFSGALNACGMENPHSGVLVPTAKLFEDWARVVRLLKKLPSTKAYRKLGKHSFEAVMRLAGQWSGVPRAMGDYARRNNLEKKWKDVMALIAEQVENDWPTNGLKWPIPAKRRYQLKKDRPIYSLPITPRAMLNVPTNESGVMFLFASMALELGFMATIVRTGFPDCEALREISPGRLQRERIEFEYLAKNFLKHRHRLDGCDILVCWINNWPDCPLEVIELRKALSSQHSAVSKNNTYHGGTETRRKIGQAKPYR